MSEPKINVPIEEIVKALADLHRRVEALENRDGGWRKSPPADATE